MPIYLILVVLAGLLGVPIVFALVLGPSIDFLINGKDTLFKIMIQRNFAGINQFALLAIPLFILAGELMNRGGITERLVNFARTLVGSFHGGLAQVNILSSIMFAGLSGSAVADTSALGAILIPGMEKDGYPKDFSAAVTAASSIIGPIIPPSIIMIVYSYIMEVSTGALFAAGVLPGITMGFALMVMTSYLARRRGYPRQPRATMKETVQAGRSSFLPLLTPVIILAGILFSIVSPTEAAIIAVAYALFLSLFILRTLRFRELSGIFGRAGLSASIILLVIGSAAMFGWVLTITRVPQDLAAMILDFTGNPYVFLFIANILLFIVGMFLDAGPAILILGPILGPTLAQLGINPTHFAIIMCLNLTVGLATPPFGLVLFAASTVTKLQVSTIVRAMLPYYLVHFAVILLITYWPALSLTLPKLLGLPI
jgi:tripartite ATP-independent transporter DctM subunit